MVVLTLLDKMRHDMPLQMVDIDQRDIQSPRQSLGKVDSHQQRPHQSRATCECDGRQLFLGDTGTTDGLIHHRHNILLVCPRSQFRHHAAISLVYFLRSCDIAQQHPITQHGGRRVVTRRLYT